MRRVACLFLMLAVVPGLLDSAVSAQDRSSSIGLDLFGQSGASGFNDPLAGDASPAKVDLVPADARPGEKVKVRITLELPPGNNTYSQNPDFSGATQLTIERFEGLEPLQQEFVPDQAPKRAFEPLFNRDVEKFFGRVIWTREFRILSDAREVTVKGNANYQLCDDQSCRQYDTPIDLTFTPAKESDLSSSAEPIVHPFSFQQRPEAMGQPGRVEVEMRLNPENAQPGDVVTLTVTMRIDDGWHTYSLTQPDVTGALPTELTLETYQGLEEIEPAFEPRQRFESKTIELPDTPPIRHQIHKGEVSWVRNFTVKPDAAGYGVSGELAYQVCSESNCLPLKSVSFALGDLTSPRDASHLNQLPVASLDFDFEIPDEFGGNLALVLIYSFLGGLILNVMPCVLPVLAIKILSFVKQAGESRARILQLNLAYSAGVIGVFLCLAFLASFLKLGWGQLFQSSEFNLVMACVVFAMGLSLLGVFEIPIPGLAGGGGQREGLSGAMLTGVFATFLATPCAGPFVGTTLAWSVAQPTEVIFLVWGVMGVGMAFPYLLTGIFPQALKYLPKPGPWMIRFKEFSGFALMGAVIWIVSFMDATATIPLLIMLMGIALSLWMIGNLYDVTSPPEHKNLVRFLAVMLGAGIIGFGYTRMLPESEHKLDWVEFSESTLQELLAENKSVLIDFTADWCLVCKQNEANALNTAETKSLVERFGVVPLIADYTNRSPEITAWLELFKNQGVPLTVIISAHEPNRPIILRGAFFQGSVTEALNKVAQQAPPPAAPAEADTEEPTTAQIDAPSPRR
jgi:suppressor for copper-sensitivity B